MMVRFPPRRLLLLLALAPLGLAAPPAHGPDWRADFNAPHFASQTDNYTAYVNASSRWGTWEGWGVSLCWWATAFGQSDDLADLLFTLKDVTVNGKSLPGLGLNIARYNLGGSGWRVVNGTGPRYSEEMPAFKKIEGFWQDWRSEDPASTSWNWSVDANQVEMLKKASIRGANVLELFSNSPMWWMLYNKNPAGAYIPETDNLQSWNYRKHAVYMATTAAYARDHWGLEFTSVEPFNEPQAPWWTPLRGRFGFSVQEGCFFKHATQADVINVLRDELDRRGLNSTIISASDESFYDWAISSWNAFDSATQAKVGRVNVHGYQYGEGHRDHLYDAVGGKKLWNTEYSDGDESGLTLASNMNLDFRFLHPTSWSHWQVLDETPGWGMLRSNLGDSSPGIEAINTKFFVMAQFMRHIRPGMIIIDSGDANTVAAYDSSLSNVILVTTNYGAARWIKYNMSSFGRVGGPVSRWTTRTNGSTLYAEDHDVVLSDQTVIAFLFENTVQTFEVEDAHERGTVVIV